LPRRDTSPTATYALPLHDALPIYMFKVSNDPHFAEKLIDVVGLYLNPPEQAMVLCMDEKSQIQALDRTQASLPMVPGRAGTMTQDRKSTRLNSSHVSISYAVFCLK